jgi:hypothetical protein
VSTDKVKRAENRGLSEEEVRAGVRARGTKPPGLRQMRRWRSLLPQVSAVPTGRRGRPRIRYAPEAIDCLEAIMKLRAGKWRRLDTIRFELWWRGIPVNADPVRTYMAAMLRKRLGNFGTTRSGSTDPLDVADEMANDLRTQKIRHAVLRLLLRRVAGDVDIAISGLYALTVFTLGGDPVWDDSSRYADLPDADLPTPSEALGKLFGFERAYLDVAPDGTRLLDEPIDVRELLIQLRDVGALDIRNAGSVIDSASLEDLARARDDAYVFAETMPIAARAAEKAFGRDFAGLGIFTILYRIASRYFRVIVLFMMLHLNRTEREGIRQINATLTIERDRFEAYLAILDRFPQYAKYYRVDQEEQLAKASPGFVDKMRLEVQAFIDDNPSIKNALLR